MSTITVSVRDFTTFPGGRFIVNGAGSAQEFFDRHIKQYLPIDELILDLDGTWDYGPSFTSQLGIYLKDSLGGEQQVRRIVRFKSHDPEPVERFWKQLKDKTE